MTWSSLSVDGEVPNCYYHATTEVGNKIFLFGGMNKKHIPTNDLFVFDTSKKVNNKHNLILLLSNQ